MSLANTADRRDSNSILECVFTEAQMRRFERMERVSQCTEIASDLNARHPYMTDEELGAQVAELLDLLIKEKAAAQLAHFYGIDEDWAARAAPVAVAESRSGKSLMARLLGFFKVGG